MAEGAFKTLFSMQVDLVSAAINSSKSTQEMNPRPTKSPFRNGNIRLPVRKFRTGKDFVVIMLVAAVLWMSYTTVKPSFPRRFGTLNLEEDIDAAFVESKPRAVPGRPVPTTLVSVSSTDSYDVIKRKEVFDGKLVHFSSSIQPSKDTREAIYRLHSAWFLETEGSYGHPYWHGRTLEAVNNFTFTCNFGQTFTSRANVQMQVRREYFLTSCDLPPGFAERLKSEDGDTQTAAFAELEAMQTSVEISVDEGTSGGTAGTHFGSMDLAWQPSVEPVLLGACLSPVRLTATTDFSDLLEWRVHHKLLGMEVVHWYSRQRSLKDWVAGLNLRYGTKDTFRYAPGVDETAGDDRSYHDQPMWYADCIMRNSFSNKWLALVDADEYIIHTEERKLNGVVDYLESLPAKVGSLSLLQSYWGGDRILDTPTHQGYARFPRDAWTKWTDGFLLGGNLYPKGIHRTSVVQTVWPHAAIDYMPGHGQRDEAASEPNHLVLLHSRKVLYDGIVLDKNWTATPEMTEFWHHMVDNLGGTQSLIDWWVDPEADDDRDLPDPSSI